MNRKPRFVIGSIVSDVSDIKVLRYRKGEWRVALDPNGANLIGELLLDEVKKLGAKSVSGLEETSEKTINTIEDAHRLATNVQNLVMKLTGASRIIVHTEPD
jgi:hypothetical protein